LAQKNIGENILKNVRLFPKLVIAIGILFAVMGLITIGAGIYINSFIGQQLADQNITTPDDASIPNEQVDDIPTALSMAAIIQEHAAARSNGLSYAEMGRFAVESGDPAGTSNADEALKDTNGNPVPNSARDTQLTAAGLVTSLSLSAMAIGTSYGAIALGIAFALLGIVIAGLGYALLGLITPEVAAQFGIRPVTE
jgi:ABC-type antimicrobial peptide transport system permease subunit